MLKKYLDESGLEASFELIFMEIVHEEIPEEQIFQYTAKRLREIGKDFKMIEQGKDPSADWKSYAIANRKASVKKTL